MTRTAIYHATPGHIVEQPAVEKPKKPRRKDYDLTGAMISAAMLKYETDLAAYNGHVSQLRTIPAHDSARSLWKDGQVLEEGRDYEVRGVMSFDENDNALLPYDKAFPLPVKSEDPDDIWFELLKHVGMDEEFILNWITELKQKYIITKR